LKHLLVALLLVLVTAGSASAEDSSTKVFLFSGSKIPRSHKDIPEVLTKAVGHAVNGDVMTMPIEDAAGMFACDIDTPACLDAVSKQVKARRIVYGTVEGRSGGSFAVTLTWYGDDGGQERKFVLDRDTDEELAEQLEHAVVTAMRTRPEKIEKTEKTEKAEKTKPVDTTPTPLPPKPPKESLDAPGGTITTGTWVMIGTGAAVAAAGGGFALWAAALAKDVRNAPTNTIEDFDRLRAMEEAGKLRARIGAGLLIGGGVITAIGVVRAVVQHKSPEQPLVDVRPEQGGASAVLTLRFH
jgi:hypothetical protein